MKKILKTWKCFLAEALTNPDESEIRLSVAEKLSDYIFKPIELSDPQAAMDMKNAGKITGRYPYLYWAVFGSKQERLSSKSIYRPKWGLRFAQDKIYHFISMLNDEQIRHLATDIDQLVKIAQQGEYPKDRVQIPVHLTGHPSVDPAFGTAFVNGEASTDWGIGGSIKTPNGESYLVHIFKTLKSQLQNVEHAASTQDQNILSIYFYGETHAEIEPNEEEADISDRFSKHALDYQNFLKSIGKA
jgi:hypothetical protein